MRSVKEYYLAKAAEFEALSIGPPGEAPILKKRYADLAQSYRLMAKERERLIANGIIESDPPPH